MDGGVNIYLHSSFLAALVHYLCVPDLSLDLAGALKVTERVSVDFMAPACLGSLLDIFVPVLVFKMG